MGAAPPEAGVGADSIRPGPRGALRRSPHPALRATFPQGKAERQRR
nr:MAG TPA: hypothetical protein [Caudoviricetes sp.]